MCSCILCRQQWSEVWQVKLASLIVFGIGHTKLSLQNCVLENMRKWALTLKTNFVKITAFKPSSLSHMGLAGLMTLTSACFIIGHSCSIWMLHSHFQIFRYPLTIAALKVNFRSILKNRNMGMSEIFQLSVSSLKCKADNQYTWRVHYLSCTWMPSHIAAVKWGDSFVRK